MWVEVASFSQLMSDFPPFGVFSKRSLYMRPFDRRRPVGGRDGLPSEAAGSRPAFEDVYQATFPLVWRLVRRLGIPPPDQADIAQEVFLRASRELDTRDPSVDLVAWLFQITTHTATRHRRLARNRREVPIDELEDLAGYREDTSLIEGVAHRERGRLVSYLVQKIENVPARLVFVMHDLEQRTIAEITRALDMPRHIARDCLVRGRKSFRAAVNALHPADRDVLGVRRSGCIPFLLLDLAKLAEAERHLDDRAADAQAWIWGRLQERMRASTGGGERAPRGTAQRAMRRIPHSAAQALGAVLVVFVAGTVVGLFARPRLPALESEAPVRISPDDVVSRRATTPDARATFMPAGTTPGGMVASWTGEAVPRSSALEKARTSRRAAGIPRADRDFGDDDETLLDRARAHLERREPRPDLAIVSLQRHSQRFPKSPRAQDREALFGRALALAAQANPSAAGSTNPMPGDGP